MTLNIRPATPADLDRIHAIYTYHVVHGTGSWEYEPPTRDIFAERTNRLLFCQPHLQKFS